MNDSDSRMALEAICHHAELAFRVIQEEQTTPSVLYRPKLTMVNGRWYANYGDVTGFGESPATAMAAFNAAWFKTCQSQ